MNEQRVLVLFEDFPKEMKLSAIIDAIYQMSGLKEQDRELSEIQGIFQAPSSAQNYVSYYVMFKYKDVFAIIDEICEIINDEKCIDIGGNLVKVTLPGKNYARTVMDKPNNNQMILKISNMVVNLKRFAITLEQSKALAQTSSTKEVHSMMIVNTGGIVVTFECGLIATEMQQELIDKKYICKEVVVHAIPRKFETISIETTEGEIVKKEKPVTLTRDVREVKQTKRKFIERKPQQDLRFKMRRAQDSRTMPYYGSQPSTSSATMDKPENNAKGFIKVKITDDIKRFCALIASDEYEVYVRKKQSCADFEDLFE